MPLTTFNNLIQTVTRDDSASNINPTWAGLFNQLTVTEDKTLNFDGVGFNTNDEVIIRNSSASTGAITVNPAGSASIDVSSDLGLVVPVGGIGQLKRIGASDTWAFYGFIEGA